MLRHWLGRAVDTGFQWPRLTAARSHDELTRRSLEFAAKSVTAGLAASSRKERAARRGRPERRCRRQTKSSTTISLRSFSFNIGTAGFEPATPEPHGAGKQPISGSARTTTTYSLAPRDWREGFRGVLGQPRTPRLPRSSYFTAHVIERSLAPSLHLARSMDWRPASNKGGT